MKTLLDRTILSLATEALDGAWGEFAGTPRGAEEMELRPLLARRILAAIGTGERDIERLKSAALLGLTR
jgi:hypothetical protein